MKTEDVALHQEGTAKGYLGAEIQMDGWKIIFTQTGLTKRIIEALGLNTKYSTAKSMPANTNALGKDLNGPPARGDINYASVIGMLLYLNHSWPDITFASHQCARYKFAPKQSHENAFKQNGQYLKGTIDKGLILNPSDKLKLDCYPDADFTGLWNRDDKHAPHCVQSCTGYVICLSDCPILWVSKLQTEIALSTMETEYVSLSTLCWDLFPLTDLTKEICSSLSLHLNNVINMHVKIHEDNVRTLLGKIEQRRMTPQSMHYAVKYHWFSKHIGPCGVELVKIASADQLGDLFTKGLGKLAFTRLQKQLMGW